MKKYYLCIIKWGFHLWKIRNKKETLSMSSIQNIGMWSGKTTCGNIIVAFTKVANDERNRGFLSTSYM